MENLVMRVGLCYQLCVYKKLEHRNSFSIEQVHKEKVTYLLQKAESDRIANITGIWYKSPTSIWEMGCLAKEMICIIRKQMCCSNFHQYTCTRADQEVMPLYPLRLHSSQRYYKIVSSATVVQFRLKNKYIKLIFSYIHFCHPLLKL